MLGSGGVDIIESGDDVADVEARQRFTGAYDAKHSIKLEGDRKGVIALGNDDFPFPIPLMRKKAGREFDTAAGRRDAAGSECPWGHAGLRGQGQDDRRLCVDRVSCRVWQFGCDDLVVNHSGTVYQKDLGDYTMKLVQRMNWFDPDQTWKKVSATAP